MVARSKMGYVFEPGDVENWVHALCVHRALVNTHALSFEGCPHYSDDAFTCDGAFYPDESVLEVVAGRFVIKPGDFPEPEFAKEEGGLMHWACAMDFTELKLVELEDDPA
jgi:hypothetical protein